MHEGRVNPEIFKAYDIRGVPQEDFDDAFARRLAARCAVWMGQGMFIVGRDGRKSSDGLALAAMEGAQSVGSDVADIGEVSSPQFYWALRSLGASGGLMVTASHNEAGMNGFKAVRRHGEQLEVVGGDRLRQLYDAHGTHDGRMGTLTGQDVIPAYADAVAVAAGWHGGAELALAIDAPPAVMRVLRRLAPVAPDHGLAAKFDADGDRVAFFEDGAEIPADFIFLLLAERLHLSPVVFDLRFSRAVRERLEALGAGYFVSAVGRLAMTQNMHGAGAEFGAETSGHYYWKAFGGMECPELTLLRVYGLAHGAGGLAGAVKPYRTYFGSGERTLPLRDRKQAATRMRCVRERYANARISQADGISIEYDDWWFNLRASNTEPVMRLVMEAKEKGLLEQKLAEVLRLVGAAAR
jgi:phosphomannomutase